MKLPRVMLGANPFHGVSYKSASLRKEYRSFFTEASRVAEIIDASWDSGVRGVHSYTKDIELDAVCEARKKYGHELKVISVMPDLYGAAARQVGAKSTGADGAKLKMLLKSMPSLMVAGVTGKLTGLVGKVLDTELSLVKKTQPDFVLLHGFLADAATATEQVEALYMFKEKVEKIGAIPGVATHNLGRTYKKLVELDIHFPVIMAPVNLNGFMMNPSKEACEQIIREATDTIFIGKKVLGGGVISPVDAQKYAFYEVGVQSVAIGIANMAEIKETFSASRQVLGERFEEQVEVKC